MTDPLARLKRAAEAKRRAEESYRAALLAAHEAGADSGQLGRAAGITRQGAWQALRALTQRRPPR